MAMEDPSVRPTAWRRWRSTLAALGIVAVVVAGTWLGAQRLAGRSSDAPAKLVASTDPVAESVAAKQGATAPDFEASGLDGVRVKLSDLRGRAVVLNFWATWCGSCEAEIRELDRVYRERSGQGLAVVGVNVGEDAQRAETFLRQDLGATYPSLLDPERTIARRYHVTGVPVTVFIGPDGVIQRLIPGQLNYTIFDRYARVALGEQGVPDVDDPLPLRFVSPLPPEAPSASGTKEAGQ